MIASSGTNKKASLCLIGALTLAPTRPPSKNSGYVNLGYRIPTLEHHSVKFWHFCLIYIWISAESAWSGIFDVIAGFDGSID